MKILYNTSIMKKKLSKIIPPLRDPAVAVIILAFLLLFAFSPVLAVDLGIEAGSETGLGTRDVRSGTMTIVEVLLGLLGIIAIIVILYGGFKWMTSGGDDTKVEESRKLLLAGAIGLAIILGAYAISYFIVTSLMKATGGG
jgi:heme/copper-type cytochrome/quinol oxidase subunit 2